MVEFALVAPLLLALVFGIVQFGIAFNNYLTLTDAVRAGSRQGAVSRLTDPAGEAVKRVRSAASDLPDAANNAGPLVVSVTFKGVGGTPGVVEQGGDITVHATYPYSIDIFGIPVHNGTLTSETTERVE
jgi:Flp pilus assembly protein TadG